MTKEKRILFLYTFILFCLSTSLIYSQERVKLFGTASAGSIVIGRAEEIKSISFEKKNILFDKEGWFVIGFDRDAKGSYSLIFTFKDKQTETHKFVIEPREYEIQRISGINKKMVTPPKKVLKRIAGETKIIAAEKKKMSAATTAFFKTGFALPIDSAEIKSVFGSARVLNGVKKAPHNGVDFAEEEGKPVKAAGDGIVILAEHNFYYNGTFIMIDHGFGLVSIYLHLSKLHVKRGDKVLKGDLIGEVGSTGRSTGAHLHWGIQLYNKRIDPLCLLQLRIKNE